MAQLELHDYLTRETRDEDYGTALMRDEDWWFSTSTSTGSSESVSLADGAEKGGGTSGRVDALVPPSPCDSLKKSARCSGGLRSAKGTTYGCESRWSEAGSHRARAEQTS